MRSHMSSWKDKTVVVTGGNAGLGKAIAGEFASAGATVISVSRTKKEDAGNVQQFEADVTSDESVEQVLKQILDAHQRIDVWINNVGQSIRTSLTDCSIEDYRRLMEINFFSAVRCSLAVLPHVEQTSGSIVFVGSLASRTGWKHIAPYVTSKHALSGFAHQFRLESPANVHSMLVCPGPIRRDDSASRYLDQTKELGDSVAAPGAGVKVSGIEPSELAKKILLAVEKRKPELVVPWKARLLFSILQLSPDWGDWLLKKFS